MQYNGGRHQIIRILCYPYSSGSNWNSSMAVLLIIERHTMNNIFARLFCSKNHSTSDEAYNIVESMAKAKPLYKELIKQAHPDKHPNNKDVAEELTAMINNNRFNYRELLKIKDLVNDKLV